MIALVEAFLVALFLKPSDQSLLLAYRCHMMPVAEKYPKPHCLAFGSGLPVDGPLDDAPLDRMMEEG